MNIIVKYPEEIIKFIEENQIGGDVNEYLTLDTLLHFEKEMVENNETTSAAYHSGDRIRMEVSIDIVGNDCIFTVDTIDMK